ncbi:MAG: TVP38/TMEM64 family protein [Dinoroseobacter sp.]|nr:TVP38/TMEM64 family protein [Dinoroseobacter sp.]
MTNHTPSKGLPRWLPFAVIAAGAAGAFYFLGDALSFQALSDNRETLLEFRDNNYLQTALAYIAIYVGIVAFSIPGATIATLAGGFMFGLLAGTVLTVIAATIGASLIFLAAKWGFGETLSAKMNASDGAIKSFSNGLKENELSYLFLIRLVPAVPFFVANLLPALVGVGLGRYVFTTFIGIIPGTAVYTWVGAGLGDVFAAGATPNLGIIFEPYILGPLLGLGALALLPVVVKLFRKES